MNNDLDLQSTTAMIHESLEEVNILLSALEEQIKSGLFFEQLEIETIEVTLPEDRSSVVEDNSFLTDEF